MRKKVFFVTPSLRAGGAERVFWILSQYFNKSIYDVSIVLFDSSDAFFSTDLEGVRIVDLKTGKASNSFFKLFNLIKEEKPYAVYSTGGHVDILISLISMLLSIPKIIARSYNIPDEMTKYAGLKSRVLRVFSSALYKRFDVIVCQSDEMLTSIARIHKVPAERLVVIPNPIIPFESLNERTGFEIEKKLIIVGRLTPEKGHDRILQVMKELPQEFHLSVAGDGPIRDEVHRQVDELGLNGRVHLLGRVSGVPQLISQHDLLVLTSYTEGFPNVVIEALSVGTPVVTFKVGGVSHIVKDGFNGFVVEQGDIETFRKRIIESLNKKWDNAAIKADTVERFGVNSIVNRYTSLIDNAIADQRKDVLAVV